MPKIKNLNGKTFGNLEVIEFHELTKQGAIWKCKCICGNETFVRGNHLSAGKIKSCSNKNQYYEQNGYMMCRVHSGEAFIIDVEDFEKANKYTWYITQGYPKAHISKTNKNIPIHNIIIDVPDGYLVDHINRDTLDNRKVNLRICTKQQNSFNSKKIENCSSNFKGVHWNKNRNKWQVSIRFNHKRYHLGYFIDEKEAAKAYNKKAKGLYGEYALLNEVDK